MLLRCCLERWRAPDERDDERAHEPPHPNSGVQPGLSARVALCEVARRYGMHDVGSSTGRATELCGIPAELGCIDLRRLAATFD